MNYAPEVGFIEHEKDGKDLASCSLSGSFVKPNSFPPSVELFSMHPLYEDENYNQLVFRFAQLNPWSDFVTTQINVRDWFSPSLSFSSIEERTLSLLHKLDDNLHLLPIPAMSMRTYVVTIGENPSNIPAVINTETKKPNNNINTIQQTKPNPIQPLPNDFPIEEPVKNNNVDESKVEGILLAGDLPLLPGQTGSNTERVHILTESLRSIFKSPPVIFPVGEYYFFLSCCCVLLIVLLVIFVQKRRKLNRWKGRI